MFKTVVQTMIFWMIKKWIVQLKIENILNIINVFSDPFNLFKYNANKKKPPLATSDFDESHTQRRHIYHSKSVFFQIQLKRLHSSYFCFLSK